MRAPLVDGHGNFGSIDPDPAAARGTPSKLARLASEALLADVGEETVDFEDNFDGSEREPVVLPPSCPCSSSTAPGIAVGMATNCPPHNLGEVVDGLRALLADPELERRGALRVDSGPGLPYRRRRDGYRRRARHVHERSRLDRRGAKAHVEPAGSLRGSSRAAIIVTELPYGVAKNSLLERIATMANEKKIDGLAEIRDESSMEGLRIVFG